MLFGADEIDVCLTDPPYGLGETKSEKNNYDSYVDSVENLLNLVELSIVQPMCEFKRTIITPGNKNQYKYPTPDWTMAWFCPAGTGVGPWGFTCWQPILCYGKDVKLANGLGSHPDAIVHQESASSDEHPCAKPIKFWVWLLERVSMVDEFVYDPFGGSGTTLIACEQTSRKCRMMELDPKYCDVIIKRWEDFTGKKAELINE